LLPLFLPSLKPMAPGTAAVTMGAMHLMDIIM
jgi:hypothetical protein